MVNCIFRFRRGNKKRNQPSESTQYNRVYLPTYLYLSRGFVVEDEK